MTFTQPRYTEGQSDYLTVVLGATAPEVAEGAWIAPSAALVGDVAVRTGASIWYGCVLRADRTQIVVGESSNLQDNCVVHGDPGFPVAIGARVSVGHSAVVHGCVIEDDCLVGMSATVMNGARIGRGSIIAAGAVVLSGTEIPAGSLVAGVPARVLRATTEGDRQEIASNARRYAELADEHANALRQQRG